MDRMDNSQLIVRHRGLGWRRVSKYWPSASCRTGRVTDRLDGIANSPAHVRARHIAYMHRRDETTHCFERAAVGIRTLPGCSPGSTSELGLSLLPICAPSMAAVQTERAAWALHEWLANARVSDHTHTSVERNLRLSRTTTRPVFPTGSHYPN